MVLKLMKHEFKYLARYLLLIWAGLLLMIVSQRFLIEFRDSDIMVLSVAANMAVPVLIFSLIAMHLVTCVVVILRFYQNMFTGEGYLTFTLPVKTGQIIFSKLLVGLVIMLAPLAVTAAIGLSFIRMDQLGKFLMEGLRYYLQSGYSLTTLILMGLTMLIGTITQMVDFYLAMSFGQLANRNKVVFSIISYIGIYTVKQLLGTVAVVGLFMSGYLESLNHPMIGEINVLLAITLLMTALLLVVEYLLVNYLCKNKLNLE